MLIAFCFVVLVGFSMGIAVGASVRACRHCGTPWWPWEERSFHRVGCIELGDTTEDSGDE
jgi:hypothetical protein